MLRPYWPGQLSGLKPSIHDMARISLNPDNEINQGLVAWWLMNEEAGPSARNLIRSNFSGVLTGAATWGQGKFGNCVNTNGASGFVKIPNILEESISALSAFIWVKTAATNNKYIFCHYEGAGNLRKWGIFCASTAYAGVTGDELMVKVTDDGTASESDPARVKIYWGSAAGDEIADNVWHLVGFTWNAGTLLLYRDGKELAVTKPKDGSFTSLKVSTASLSIGCVNPDSTPTAFMAGLTDLPFVANRVLPLREIQELYLNPFGTPSQPRLLYAAPRTWLIPAAGGTIYTYVASGGLTIGGSAATSKTKATTASGGITTGGAAAVCKTKSMTASGEIETGGSAIIAKTKAHVASGGTSISGSAALAKVKAWLATGGIELAGAAAISKMKAFITSGGLTASGAAVLSKTKAYSATGGLVAGGAAITSYTPAGAQEWSWTGTGGIALAGSAATSKTKAFTASGGISLSGTSVCSYTASAGAHVHLKARASDSAKTQLTAADYALTGATGSDAAKTSVVANDVECI